MPSVIPTPREISSPPSGPGGGYGGNARAGAGGAAGVGGPIQQGFGSALSRSSGLIAQQADTSRDRIDGSTIAQFDGPRAQFASDSQAAPSETDKEVEATDEHAEEIPDDDDLPSEEIVDDLPQAPQALVPDAIPLGINQINSSLLSQNQWATNLLKGLTSAGQTLPAPNPGQNSAFAGPQAAPEGAAATRRNGSGDPKPAGSDAAQSPASKVPSDARSTDNPVTAQPPKQLAADTNATSANPSSAVGSSAPTANSQRAAAQGNAATVATQAQSAIISPALLNSIQTRSIQNSAVAGKRSQPTGTGKPTALAPTQAGDQTTSSSAAPSNSLANGLAVPASDTSAAQNANKDVQTSVTHSTFGSDQSAHVDGEANATPAQATALRAQALRGLVAAISRGDTGVRIRLDPRELGTLSIDLRLQDGLVQAKFEVTTPQAHRLLNGSLADLRRDLESRGVEVGRLEVAHAKPPAEPGGSTLTDEHRPHVTLQNDAAQSRTGTGGAFENSHTQQDRSRDSQAPAEPGLSDDAVRSGQPESPEHELSVAWLELAPGWRIDATV